MASQTMRGEMIWYGGELETIIMRVRGEVTENLVQFTIDPTEDYWGYEVSLSRKETGTIYEGSYVSSDGRNGSVDCEVFKSIEGADKYVLHGKWFEERQYFWFARFFPLIFPD